jgi:transcriptional regulator with XRE-family HTH domain
MMFEKLKELRDYEAKTQRETAKDLHVTRATYAGWECGKDIIPLRKLNDLANIYDVTLDYLVGLTENQENRPFKMDIDPKVVSENIKLLRLSRQLTQKEMAESLKTSQSNIHNYENGKSLITTMYAIELAKNYDYSLDKLIRKTK